MKKSLLLQGTLKIISGLLLMGALLFLPAGTWNYPGAWRLMALLFIPMLNVSVILYIKSPGLLRKRLNSREQESEQKRVILLSAMAFVASFILAGLDFRFDFTNLSKPLVWVGMILFLLAYGLYLEVMRENAYLSRTVEIQEGQKVIDTGLYGIVRHPMYTAAILLFLSMPLVLGSGVAMIPMLFVPAILVKRIKNEEQVLEQGLSGYLDYKERVRYRIIPFVW